VIPIELRTERLFLRPWRDSDAERLAAIYAQPGYLEHMDPVPSTQEQIEKFRRGWAEDGLSQWAAEDPETGRFIGRLGLLRHHDWPLAPDPVEVGWVLDEAYWGRGLATEAGLASLDLWRSELLDDAQLISITNPGNLRSRAVMERLGLTHRGETRWRTYDVVWYAIDR
jgi:RimJ/RimL family protein N-acetyltransferase